jgi:hypothetical protein
MQRCDTTPGRASHTFDSCLHHTFPSVKGRLTPQLLVSSHNRKLGIHMDGYGVRT